MTTPLDGSSLTAEAPTADALTAGVLPADALKVEDLSFDYEVGDTVLFRTSFAIPKGSICGLLGRNGCGKSTLLQCVLGLLDPQEGGSQVLGLDPRSDLFEIRQRVGYVPQEPLFEANRTAEEHLDFARPLYDGRWNRELEDSLVDSFGLALELSKPVGQLSLGQQRQLSLVFALAFEPELLVLDEPTASLDAVVRRRFTERVVDFMSTPGHTVLLASHLISDLERLVDHVVVLDGRTTLLDASLEAIKERLLCVRAELPADDAAELEIPGTVTRRRSGSQLDLAVWDSGGGLPALTRTLEEQGVTQIVDIDPSLENLFVHLLDDPQRQVPS